MRDAQSNALQNFLQIRYLTLSFFWKDQLETSKGKLVSILENR